MSGILNGQDITTEMAAAWGLPPNTKCIDIHIPADGIVEVTCSYFPDEHGGAKGMIGWLKQHEGKFKPRSAE